ncbi:hypothetical protein STEG23_017747 [Scotinomys teguina]
MIATSLSGQTEEILISSMLHTVPSVARLAKDKFSPYSSPKLLISQIHNIDNAAVTKMMAKNLRSWNEELLKQLDQLKVELSQLGVAKVTGGAVSKLFKIEVVRKSIAGVLIV